MKIDLIKAERILSPTQISIAQYTINPYRGCPFGCVYCYAQENKSIKKRNLKWGTFIDVKTNTIELLKQEIKNKQLSRVLLGSTVECYPPQEKDFLITREIIELLNKNNIAVTILTKSCLIKRDLDLISKFKGNKIYLTINFDSEKLKNIFEPNSPSIKERLDLLKQINRLNINNRVHIAPLIPYVQNIQTICLMVKDYAQEISIELYNFRMGSWQATEEIIKNNFPDEIFYKINQIVSYPDSYKKYLEELSKEIDKAGKESNKKITLLEPNLLSYYKSDIMYECE